MTARRVVIGVGNEYRRDDGFGPCVLAELATRRDRDHRLARVELRVSDGEPARLLDAWAGADLAVLVDVAAGAGEPGGWSELALPETGGRHVTSGHDVGLGDSVALARALDRLPGRLVVLVAHGEEFGFGVGLSAAVAAVVTPVTDRVCELVTAP
ncbi:hydrogenase maturation protease [Paractinoplanes brasiliensis]|uniref:Hydrogenase maturation protease n=1 Tax=Paractinoplanes brasiliensis TaxID=52695 RepID=A0A4V6PST6_9ACTN|nr:hydrogenase maturation protease [Actinoplanes brasiliensis]TDO36728.1 hydrogenase maturation protease [Actinoplanes brasiliensis]GID32366.1 peptidase M52 [Actinoplanes brasiliensis]